MTQPTAPTVRVYDWPRLDVDFVRLEGIAIDGVPVALAELDVALLAPPRTHPSDDTVWTDPTADPDDGVPRVRIAGLDADDLAGALVLAAAADLWLRVQKNGATKTARFARFNLI